MARRTDLTKEEEHVLYVMKELRLEDNVKQHVLAKVLGLQTGGGYSAIECGKTKMTIRQLSLLADFYEVSIKMFFKG